MRHAIALLALLLASAPVAHAQVTNQNPVAKGAVTPDVINKRLEELAALAGRVSAKGIPRAAIIDFAWAQDDNEYRGLNKHVVVLVVAVSQDKAELPLKRVYVTDDRGREIVALRRISSERREVPKESPVHTLIGAHREDSFYLAPAKVMMGEGSVLIDFAVRRSGFRAYELPGTPPDFIKADPSSVPARNAHADARAIKALIDREYTGFRLQATAR